MIQGRRSFVKTSSGLWIAGSVPLLSACPEDVDIEAIIRLVETIIKIADRIAGALETKNRGTRPAEKFVYENLYRADSDGEPDGTPLKEYRYVVSTPDDGRWHTTQLRGLVPEDEGEFVVVADATDFYAVSDVVTVVS